MLRHCQRNGRSIGHGWFPHAKSRARPTTDGWFQAHLHIAASKHCACSRHQSVHPAHGSISSPSRNSGSSPGCPGRKNRNGMQTAGRLRTADKTPDRLHCLHPRPSWAPSHPIPANGVQCCDSSSRAVRDGRRLHEYTRHRPASC